LIKTTTKLWLRTRKNTIQTYYISRGGGDFDKIQKIEPKVNAFDYAYALYPDYLTKKMPNWDLTKFVTDYCNSTSQQLRVLSLGSGTGDWEVDLLEKIPNIEFVLVDINDDLLSKTAQHALKKNLKLKVKIADANELSLEKSSYDLVVVRSSLHHFIKLEHIFSQISLALKDGGLFLVIGEVIGRNGEKLFPETRETAQKIFDILPDKYRLNR